MVGFQASAMVLIIFWVFFFTVSRIPFYNTLRIVSVFLSMIFLFT